MAAAARAPRKQPYRLAPPVVPEHSFQKQVTDVLRLEIAPPGKLSRFGVLWYSIDHANFAGEIPGIRLGRGIIAGIPDTFLLYRGRAHMIELKSADGSLAEAQQSVSAGILAGGGRVAVCDSIDQVLAALDEWGIPRAGRIRAA